MWEIIFYEQQSGKIPVEEFLKSLPKKQHAKAIHEIELLEQFGTLLRMPHARHIDSKLWELRIKTASNISRIFYFIHDGNEIVLLHGFIKKTSKSPSREIRKANDYMEDYERRSAT